MLIVPQSRATRSNCCNQAPALIRTGRPASMSVMVFIANYERLYRSTSHKSVSGQLPSLEFVWANKWNGDFATVDGRLPGRKPLGCHNCR